MVSGHWHIPLREAALLDFAIVFPESTETIERKSLSDTAGTCKKNTKGMILESIIGM
jgi:hypothetical protein